MQSHLANEEDDKIFRLLMPDFNLFMPQLEKDTKSHENGLIKFLRNLKALIRASNAVCVISVDQDLLSSKI
jgi:hypothetical protein